MKLKKDFVLRQVADNWIVLPVGETSISFNGMVSLNETGALLWSELERGGGVSALTDALTTRYDVDREIAAQDVLAFLSTIREIGCLEE